MRLIAMTSVGMAINTRQKSARKPPNFGVGLFVCPGTVRMKFLLYLNAAVKIINKHCDTAFI